MEASALNSEFWDGFLIFSMYRRRGTWDNRSYVSKRVVYETAYKSALKTAQADFLNRLTCRFRTPMMKAPVGWSQIDPDQVLIITLTWRRHKFSVEYIRKSEMSYILSLGCLLGSSSPFTAPKSCSGCLPIWGQLSLVACSGSLAS